MEDKDIIAASDLRKTSSTDPQLAQIARDLSDMGRRLQEIASTISSKSQETTQSSGRYRNGQNHTRSSNPTSYSSHPLHFGDRKSPESDLEVQHGSSDHLCPESSSELSLSSEDPRKDLPLPSTQDRIRNVGQHLPDLIQHPATAAALQPHTDEEARAVMDRRNRATGEQSNLPRLIVSLFLQLSKPVQLRITPQKPSNHTFSQNQHRSWIYSASR